MFLCYVSQQNVYVNTSFLHRFTLTRTRSQPTYCFIVFFFFSSTAEDFDVFERRSMGRTGDEPSEGMEGEEQMPACTCKLFDGKPCHTRFDKNKLFMFRLTSIGLSRENLDANILGYIGAGFHQSDTTEGTKQKSTDRVASPCPLCLLRAPCESTPGEICVHSSM